MVSDEFTSVILMITMLSQPLGDVKISVPINTPLPYIFPLIVRVLPLQSTVSKLVEGPGDKVRKTQFVVVPHSLVISTHTSSSMETPHSIAIEFVPCPLMMFISEGIIHS